MNEEMLKPKAVRDALGISQATYYRWVKEGRLKGVRVGGRWRFSRQAIDELLCQTDPYEVTKERELKAARKRCLDRLVELGRNEQEVEKMLKQVVSSDGEAIAQMILEHAVARHASEVHVQPVADGVGVRERIDGRLLAAGDPLPAGAAEAVIDTFKRHAKMNLEVKEASQTRRFFATVDGRKIDVWATTFPTGLGESLTLRVLDAALVSLDLSAAGFTSGIEAALREAALGPRNGVFIVNGPTGSGKSTTLYCMLNELNTPGRKIMTVEDPVEYHIDGLLQANLTSDLSFRDGLVTMLRSSADVGMVSEMRDGETIHLLFTMASTGHKMFTAMHAPDSLTVIQRVLEIGGVEGRLLADHLLGVLDQRLARRSCKECRETRVIEPSDAERLGVAPADRDREVSYNTGCEACHGTGHRGRRACAELLLPTPALRKAIEEWTTDRDSLAAVLPDDHRTLREDVLDRMFAGDINPDSAAEVLGLQPVY